MADPLAGSTSDGAADRHVDVRVSEEERRHFYDLYHKWATGREEPSIREFFSFLIDSGERQFRAINMPSREDVNRGKSSQFGLIQPRPTFT